MEKIKTLQAARGVAAFMVLCFHATSVDQKFLADPVLPEFFSSLQVGLDLFFVLSGFVMTASTAGRSRGPMSSFNFIAGRFARIYPTYWTYLVPLIAIYLLLPGSVISSDRAIDLVGSIFLLPSDAPPLLPVAWSLTLELWFYAVFAATLLTPKAWTPWALGAWLGAVLLSASFVPLVDSSYWRAATHPFAVEFIAGAAAGLFWSSRLGRSLGRTASTFLIAIGIACIGVALSLGVFDGSDVIGSVSLIRVGLMGPGYSLLILGLAAFERLGHQPLRPLSALGNCSYTLYLSHVMVMNAAAQIWFSSPLRTMGGAAFWLLTIVLCVGFSFAAYALIERPVNQIVRARLAHGYGRRSVAPKPG
jgi:exopolysaccharide production protein ExoZ